MIELLVNLAAAAIFAFTITSVAAYVVHHYRNQ